LAFTVLTLSAKKRTVDWENAKSAYHVLLSTREVNIVIKRIKTKKKLQIVTEAFHSQSTFPKYLPNVC
jgi:hypothetical protein